MSMIAVPVPREVSRLFTTIEIPGERDPSDHITLIHLGDSLPINTVSKIIPLIYDITSKMEPFLVSCKKITTFPKGENGYPIIAMVDAPQLKDIYTRLKRVLDRKGIKYSDDHPTFNPHVTLGYNKKKTKNITFPKTQWQVNEIGLYGGDSHDEKVFVSFPLSLNVVQKKAAYIDELARSWNKKVEG